MQWKRQGSVLGARNPTVHMMQSVWTSWNPCCAVKHHSLHWLTIDWAVETVLILSQNIRMRILPENLLNIMKAIISNHHRGPSDKQFFRIAEFCKFDAISTNFRRPCLLWVCTPKVRTPRRSREPQSAPQPVTAGSGRCRAQQNQNVPADCNRKKKTHTSYTNIETADIERKEEKKKKKKTSQPTLFARAPIEDLATSENEILKHILSAQNRLTCYVHRTRSE